MYISKRPPNIIYECGVLDFFGLYVIRYVKQFNLERIKSMKESDTLQSSDREWIIPLNGYILVRPLEPRGVAMSGSMAVGNILVPESEREDSLRATVIAVCDYVLEGDNKRKPNVSVGDIVIHRRFGLNAVSILGDVAYTTHYLIRETEILGVLGEKEDK